MKVASVFGADTDSPKIGSYDTTYRLANRQSGPNYTYNKEVIKWVLLIALLIVLSNSGIFKNALLSPSGFQNPDAPHITR